MRKRTDPAIIRYALYLYFNSRSFRLAARSLSPIKRRSHVAVWKWVQKYSSLADRFRTDRRLVRAIFVDETLLQIDGHDYWLWIAYEPTIGTCLMMHLSRERTIFVCYQFFKQLQRRYGRRPIFTDGAQWYNDACRWLRLRHYVYGTELKNLMERFIQHIKDRTECFDDHFPCRKENCDRQHVWNWFKLFLLYLHMGADMIRFMTFLAKDGG
ncbi:DDE-type integrase/transposase/recombinase [Nitrososphaera viennensis]|uniref:DDE-type integrase/transposase/recombinase n=2 Tax=Nitrososphaera viennensis TaxID=1034015 RepID=A0A977IDI2_9ARCH|nr:DDE-type integrase/transposase/recombinase [Nitrososphaera viennensis]AIC14486.1 putative integrase family protein [Nitrososphaera viennensis EN76]AIC15856.1 putative integrase family protein [Nitrososphaera viennensis EN76]AIC16257.1 putative integrase family protein [Nitrososphaera viennensis EN76]AIC16390.1 putative integrase family protein [Nitrososphaera viennensis EN76]AIC16837.1 putative transposase [Nitrososphaera viennensis EN76]